LAPKRKREGGDSPPPGFRFSPRSSALNGKTGRALRLSCGKLRREPAIGRFDGSFAPTSACDERFARQHRGGPPPGFLPASSDADVVHRLSGTDGRAPGSGAGPGGEGSPSPPRERAPGRRWGPESRGTSRRRGEPPPSHFRSARRIPSPGTVVRFRRGDPRTLARPLDSLVRVSRRVGGDPPTGTFSLVPRGGDSVSVRGAPPPPGGGGIPGRGGGASPPPSLRSPGGEGAGPLSTVRSPSALRGGRRGFFAGGISRTGRARDGGDPPRGTRIRGRPGGPPPPLPPPRIRGRFPSSVPSRGERGRGGRGRGPSPRGGGPVRGRRSGTAGRPPILSRRFPDGQTLSSESFATFPRGTCRVSVFRPCRRQPWMEVSHPSSGGTLERPDSPGPQLGDGSRRGPVRFGLGRFPLRSRLLGESRLVSFPPPIDMLKFGGWSRSSMPFCSTRGFRPR